jgi:hypothetical protein
MCLYLPKNSTPKVAEKDIVCYKYLIRGRLAPFHLDFRYKLRKLNKPIKLVKDVVMSQSEANYIKNEYIICEIVNEGYHSYKTFEKAVYHNIAQKVYECIIPAGTQYYENHDEYVSENIIIRKRLFWKQFFAEFFSD